MNFALSSDLSCVKEKTSQFIADFKNRVKTEPAFGEKMLAGAVAGSVVLEPHEIDLILQWLDEAEKKGHSE